MTMLITGAIHLKQLHNKVNSNSSTGSQLLLACFFLVERSMVHVSLPLRVDVSGP